jgi:hypothetical protein
MIGELTRQKANKMVQELLDLHWSEIVKAYAHQEDSKLQVSLSISLAEVKGRVWIDAGITFVADRVKEHTQASVDEVQRPLLEAVERLRPKKGSGIDSVTISSPGSGIEPVTLKAK